MSQKKNDKERGYMNVKLRIETIDKVKELKKVTGTSVASFIQIAVEEKLEREIKKK